MDERKILAFILCFIIYCLYSICLWFTSEVTLTGNTEIDESAHITPEPKIEAEVLANNTTESKEVKVKKVIPLFMKNACSVLQVFTEKPKMECKEQKRNMESDYTVAVIGLTIFLIGLTVHAVLDVLKVKEEEKARRKLNPDGERRQSLAEFANKKTLRRESSRFGFQLFQIFESNASADEDKKNARQTRPYKRGDSTNSYLSDRKKQNEGSAPASIGDTSDPKMVKRQSAAKLFGARPVPMVRRSSFPALPLNPDVQAAMLGQRQQSVDSDEEDKKYHRVRILRRF